MRGNDLPKEREREREKKKLIDRVKNSIQLFHSLPSDEQREERERKKEREKEKRSPSLSLSLSLQTTYYLNKVAPCTRLAPKSLCA
jgi:two-component sensor histidine kinase